MVGRILFNEVMQFVKDVDAQLKGNKLRREAPSRSMACVQFPSAGHLNFFGSENTAGSRSDDIL